MKKIGEFIKNHKLLVIILAAVIFLAALWTPVILILSRQSNSAGSSSLVDTSGVSSEVFAGDYSVLESSASTESVVSQESTIQQGSANSSSENAQSSSSIASDTKSQTSSGAVESSAKPQVSSSTQTSSKPQSSSEIPSSSKVESSSKESTVSKISRPQYTSGDKIEFEEEDPIAKDAPRIICWGDSITQGMGMAEGDDYPGVLQSLVGTKYRVLNAGSGGEKSQTIAARQGAYEVFLKADLVFKKDYGSITLDETNGFVLADGTLLDINEDGESFRNDVPCKKIYIDGKQYELYANGESIEIIREEYKKKLVLKKGSKVVFESANAQKGSYCEIFYVSANDAGHREGDSEDVEYLIGRYKAMAKRHGDDKYMVIIPQWAGGYAEPLKAEFGERAVDIKAEICKRVIEMDGYFPSEEDIREAKEGRIPTSLKYDNNPNDSLHLNEDGYKLMGTIIYENGVKLGYWK